MTNNDDTTPCALERIKVIIGPRPGKKSIAHLAENNLTHCCTLLNEREDVQPIKKICQQQGWKWIWLPIDGGKLDTLRQTNVMEKIDELIRQTSDTPNPRIYFHCSAGIHRTGFFVYILLRLRGLEKVNAIKELTKIREVTAAQVGSERLKLADEIIDK